MKFYELEEGKIYKCDMFDDNLYKREDDELLEYRSDKKWHIVEVSVFHIYKYDFEEIIEKRTSWERVDSEERYYYIRHDGTIGWFNEYRLPLDENQFNNYNYFSTKEKAEQIRDMNLLQRMMQKFADENNEDEIDWEKQSIKKYWIAYEWYFDKYSVNWAKGAEGVGVTYFTSTTIAERCIEEVIKPFYNKQSK